MSTETQQETAYLVEYHSNNSGGSWWLTDADWKALEDAGWTVEWLGLNFCGESGALASWNRGRPAPNVHEQRECPGHRGAETYDEALDAGKDARWLGSIARSARIEVKAYSDTLAEGVAELWWSEALPGQDASDEGCNCCGQPHSFYARPAGPVS